LNNGIGKLSPIFLGINFSPMFQGEKERIYTPGTILKQHILLDFG